MFFSIMRYLMTQKVGNVVVIYAEKSQQCDDCGKIDELRPYGPNGSKICYDCAMKDEIGTEIRMAKILFGDDMTREEAEEILRKRKT